MASPRRITPAAGFTPAWWTDDVSASLTSITSLPSSSPDTTSPLKFDTVVSASSPVVLDAVAVSTHFVMPAVSAVPFEMNMDNYQFMENFPQAKIVDYHEIQRRAALVSPPPCSKELVLYEPPETSKNRERNHLLERQREENDYPIRRQREENHQPLYFQERLEEVVKDLVSKEVRKLRILADAEVNEMMMMMKQAGAVEEDAGKQIPLPAEQAQAQAQAELETPKKTDTEQAPPKRGRSRSATSTKQVAEFSDVSFQMPDDFQVDDDNVNQLVPNNDAVLRDIVTQRKKYSFSERLRGWKMQTRVRLQGMKQFDKYFTHIQSNIVTRSIPETVKFIIYEVTPKTIREGKRKLIDPCSPPIAFISNDESCKEIGNSNISSEVITGVDEEPDENLYVELFLRVAWKNHVHDTLVPVPSMSEWKASEAAKKKKKTKKARTAPCSDAEAASLLMDLAGDKCLEPRREEACNNDMSGFAAVFRSK